MEKHKVVFVKLFPEISNVTRDNPPIASFIMRVISSALGDRKALTHPGSFLDSVFLHFFVVSTVSCVDSFLFFDMMQR